MIQVKCWLCKTAAGQPASEAIRDGWKMRCVNRVPRPEGATGAILRENRYAYFCPACADKPIARPT